MQSITWSFLMLIGVVALIPVTLWILKRLQKVRAGTHQNLELVSQMSVGQRERVAIVRFNDRHLAIGITAHQVTFLADLDSTSSPSAGRSTGAPAARGADLAFSQALSTVRARHAED